MKRAFLLFLCMLCFAWAQEETGQDKPGNEGFNAMAELTKTTLVLANGKSVKGASALANKKYIALYFSAHWCGPCRGFTPDLVKFRDNCANKNLPFEVVFVSSDKSNDEMKEYMTGMDMKWLAIPYASPLREKIKSQFNVHGIPTLIILDEKGNVVSRDARWDVAMLGNDAYKRWQSPNYKPLTYEDYQKTISKKDDKKTDTKTASKKDSKKTSSKAKAQDKKSSKKKSSKKENSKKENSKKESSKKESSKKGK